MIYKNKILGSILNNYALIDMFNIEPDLFQDSYKEIFKMCLLEKNKGFKSFDGGEFDKRFHGICFDILSERTTESNFEHYLRLHAEQSKKSELRELMVKISELSEDKQNNVNDLINTIYTEIGHIKNNTFAVDDIYRPNDMADIIDKFKTGEIKKMSDVRYGYELMDKYALGMHPKQITMLAAKTGKGKSTLSINLAKNVGINQGHRVLYISNEMDKERTVKRLQSCESGIDSDIFANLNDSEDYRYENAKERIKKSNIIITGNAPKTISDVALIIRRNNTDGQLKVVIYDYLGETKDNTTKGITEWEKLTIYTQQLLEVAREQNVHIIILNQFSKESEKGNSFNARGAMLGGSGILHKVDRFFYFDYDDLIKKYVLSIEKNRDGDCCKIIYDFYKHTQQIVESGMYEEPMKQEKEMPF